MLWAYLFSWATVGIISAAVIGVGAGVLSMTPPAFDVARVCFTASALMLALRVGWWLAVERPLGTTPAQAMVFAFVTMGGIATIWIASLTWVDGRKALADKPTEPRATLAVPAPLAPIPLADHQPPTAKSSPTIAPAHDTTYDPLKPASEPDPVLRISPEVAQEAVKDLPPEMAAEVMRNLTGEVPFAKQVPRGALKIYMGSSLGFTTKDSQVVIRIAQEELLTIHRRPYGISVDVKIFGQDDRIIMELENNKPYANPRHQDYWRTERPDAHTLVVHDSTGHRVLSIIESRII